MKRPERTIMRAPEIRGQQVQTPVRRVSLEDKIMRLVRRYRAAERRRLKRESEIEPRVTGSAVRRVESERSHVASVQRKCLSSRD
jgi:hypothetical protein